jgi:D-erythronate 2-dehydrogenase
VRIIVTGAGGFVGRALIKALHEHQVIAIDRSLNELAHLPYVTVVVEDISQPETLARAFANGCDAVIHLATVPGGAAEADPALAKLINIDASMLLIDAAARAGHQPRFIFASSIAVYGNVLPECVDDHTPVRPFSLYGAHKAMIEQWLAAQTRRGALDGLSLRLPGIVARPRGPSGMKSAFMSDVFHALRSAERYELPVTPHATSLLLSITCMVQNLVAALQLDTHQLNDDRVLLLPALRVTMQELVNEIARQTGSEPALVSYRPDANIEAMFGTLPDIKSMTASAMGLVHDGDVATLVERALNHIAEEEAA